jgi:hypothetical protein
VSWSTGSAQLTVTQFKQFQTTPGTYVISGVVREVTSAGAVPVEGAYVNTWLQGSNVGSRFGHQLTDTGGHYRFVGVPAGPFSLYVERSGYDQPCAAMVDSADANLDIDIVSQSAPSQHLIGVSPTISGLIFETTSERRQPIPGAAVTLSLFGDVFLATTTSDDNGRYLLCRVPAGVPNYARIMEISAEKIGYSSAFSQVQIQIDTLLDIELKRQ